jgi:hypothetical protein
MRIPSVVAIVATFLLAAVVSLPVSAGDSRPDYSEFLSELDGMGLGNVQDRRPGTFYVNTATWNERNRSLTVDARSFQEKGILLTLMGLPASTWVDAFKISSDYSADFQLAIPEGQAVPCQVMVRSAVGTRIVSVRNAPSACGSLLGIEGNITAGSGLPLTSGRVTVAVGDNAFTTTTDVAGNYALEVYSESDDALVTIMAEGVIDAERREWHIYEGSIGGLQGTDDARTSIWATELFGRNEGRILLAAVTPP